MVQSPTPRGALGIIFARVVRLPSPTPYFPPPPRLTHFPRPPPLPLSPGDVRANYGSIVGNLQTTIQWAKSGLSAPGCWGYPDSECLICAPPLSLSLSFFFSPSLLPPSLHKLTLQHKPLAFNSLSLSLYPISARGGVPARPWRRW